LRWWKCYNIILLMIDAQLCVYSKPLYCTLKISGACGNKW
jgi:hypothetical protein